MELIIERLQQADENAVRDVNNLLRQLKSVFKDEETLESLQKTVSNPQTIAMVARNGTQIVGMAFLYVMQTLQKPSAHVDDVVVDASMQGHGLGTKLMQALIDAAREFGVGDIELTSKPSRVAANKLYQKLGFKLRETNCYKLTL